MEVLYFLAPNVKQRFAATLPGAVLSVAVWNGLSFLLGFYFRYANFNRTYGTLWRIHRLHDLAVLDFVRLLVGAELNAELAKESEQGGVQPKEISPQERARNAACPA